MNQKKDCLVRTLVNENNLIFCDTFEADPAVIIVGNLNTLSSNDKDALSKMLMSAIPDDILLRVAEYVMADESKQLEMLPKLKWWSTEKITSILNAIWGFQARISEVCSVQPNS